MNEMKRPLSKKEDIVTQELPGELLIYNLATDRAFCLNETATFVWREADGRKSVGEIKELMEREFKTLVNEDLVRLALEQLARDGLLESAWEEKAEEKFAGMTRREVVRRIGVSSLIALPVIASLATPVHAVGCPFSGAITQKQCSENPDCSGRACTTGGNCTSGACASAIYLEG